MPLILDANLLKETQGDILDVISLLCPKRTKRRSFAAVRKIIALVEISKALPPHAQTIWKRDVSVSPPKLNKKIETCLKKVAADEEVDIKDKELLFSILMISFGFIYENGNEIDGWTEIRNTLETTCINKIESLGLRYREANNNKDNRELEKISPIMMHNCPCLASDHFSKAAFKLFRKEELYEPIAFTGYRYDSEQENMVAVSLTVIANQVYETPKGINYVPIFWNYHFETRSGCADYARISKGVVSRIGRSLSFLGDVAKGKGSKNIILKCDSGNDIDSGAEVQFSGVVQTFHDEDQIMARLLFIRTICPKKWSAMIAAPVVAPVSSLPNYISYLPKIHDNELNLGDFVGELSMGNAQQCLLDDITDLEKANMLTKDVVRAAELPKYICNTSTPLKNGVIKI
ncbi:MAG: hypothetical protein HWE34_11905 [Methylocystaceae bacterium]|nr:hypothetical protein [Methylocystaceae bacterium]